MVQMNSMKTEYERTRRDINSFLYYMDDSLYQLPQIRTTSLFHTGKHDFAESTLSYWLIIIDAENTI